MKITLRQDGRILVERDGNHRGVVEPNDTYTLKSLAPELTEQQLSDIQAAWNALPGEG